MSRGAIADGEAFSMQLKELRLRLSKLDSNYSGTGLN
jgi:hypothetical protein